MHHVYLSPPRSKRRPLLWSGHEVPQSLLFATTAAMAGIGGAGSVLELELSCPVCLSTFQDPVSLGCGHCFCKSCISEALSHQREQGRGYTCPMCQAHYDHLPTFTRNLQLSSIVDVCMQKSTEELHIPCDDCLDEASIAVKTCVSCEATLCHKHVERHVKRGHMLLEPTACVQDRKCCDHAKLLEYVCQEDDRIICVTCYIAGSHKGHSIMTLKEAREKHQATLSATTTALSHSLSTFCKDIKDLEAGLEKIAKNTERFSKPIQDLRDEIIMQVKDQFKEISQKIVTNQAQATSKVTAVITQMEEAKKAAEEALGKLSLISQQTDDLLFVKEYKHLQALIKQKCPQINTMRVVAIEADKTMIADVNQETTDYISSIKEHLTCMHDALSQQINEIVCLGIQRVVVPNAKKGLPTKRRKSDKMDLNFEGSYYHCNYIVTVSNQQKTLAANFIQHHSFIPHCTCKLPVSISNCISAGRSRGKLHCLVDVSKSDDWCVGIMNAPVTTDLFGGKRNAAVPTDLFGVIRNVPGTERYLRLKKPQLSYESKVSLLLGVTKINMLKMQLDFDHNLLGFYDASCDPEIPILICKCDYVFTPAMKVGFNIYNGSLSLI